MSEATEASGAEFGIERLKKEFQRSRGGCLDSVHFILDRLNEFTGGGPARDDITFLAVGRS